MLVLSSICYRLVDLQFEYVSDFSVDSSIFREFDQYRRGFPIVILKQRLELCDHDDN